MYYGMNEETKAGHWLCVKCHTWNRDYGSSATKKVVVCPFCSTQKPNTNVETAKGGKPTQIDKDLFNYLTNATDSQKEEITKHIGTDQDLFIYMKNIDLNEKTKIMKFIEDEL